MIVVDCGGCNGGGIGEMGAIAGGVCVDGGYV